MAALRQLCAAATTALLLAGRTTAQTSTDCNPTTTTCDPVTALGMAVNVDFTQGEVNSFSASGGTPSYGSDGVTFTIAAQGESPQLNSGFYIMFGRVEITMKCASGTGIVSSVVLESDDLDEIDMEFLGVRSAEVQTMYFGRGQTPSNGQVIVQTTDNQADFVTYAMDWTANRIIWSVAGEQVRVLEYDDAAGLYPQTPMQLKFGIWAGGDPSNAAGTISWAGGTTDYADGPFSMTVQSVDVTDYSTGTQYKYGNMNGTWQSIESVGGEINANAGEAASATEVSGASQSTGTGFPSSGIGGTSTSDSDITIPSGWHMNSEGQIRPNGASAMSPPNAILLAGPLSFFLLAAMLGRWR
ncbi:unnamed protein product [Discula destructiva]